MKFIATLFLCVAGISAALPTHLPLTQEEINKQKREAADWVILGIEFLDFPKPPVWWGFTTNDFGETVNKIARRSEAELKTFLSGRLRSFVSETITNPAMVGATVSLSIRLYKRVDMTRLTNAPPGLWMGGDEKSVKLKADLAISEEDVPLNLFGGTDIWLENILHAEIEVDNAELNMHYSESVFTSSNEDWIEIDSGYISEPAFQKGTITLWYRGGIMQKFARPSGNLLYTVFPKSEPVSVASTADGIVVTVNSADTILDVSAWMPSRWQEMPRTNMLHSASTGYRYVFPKGTACFFQARTAP